MSGEKSPLRQQFTDSEIAQALHKIMIDSQVLHTCTNCINWAKSGPQGEGCMRYKARPPAEVIVIGCSMWEADIPF